MENDAAVDSRWSWVVAMAAFLAHLITHGIVYSFGILFLTLQENFKGTKAELSWIPSLTTGCLYLIGPVASILINRYGCRTVTILGAILGCIGYLTSIFVQQLFVLYFTLGIVAGSGFGMVFLPSIIIVTKYFHKYRSLACGLALSGAGGGAFILSPLIDLLIDTYAWKGTLLLLSAIILNCIPCALIFRALPKQNCANRTQVLGDTTNCDEEKISFLNVKDSHCTGENTTDENTRDVNFDKAKNKSGSKNQLAGQGHGDYRDEPTDSVVIEIVREDALSGKNIQQIDCSNDIYFSKDSNEVIGSTQDGIVERYKTLFRCTEVVVFFFTQFLFFAGFYIPFIYIPDKATSDGVNGDSAAWIASTIGISSIAGRVVLGYVADRPFANRMTMFKIALVISGISTALLPLFETLWLFLVYAVIYGISSGITLSLTSVVLADITGINLLADAMGLNNLFSAFGSLLGPPITGLLYDVTQTYTASFLAAGFAMTTSGILLVLVSFCRKQS
ncbi:monocarboxylate transporter 13-like isoform X2 [Ruditapes philippinarum]|nr:monocarboxylate transporter 13-like isoform X2 [Ruditapes philippinarum]XP_060565304.1 monocarboxylate transporter 13-like isoform X2 [Ruditapes philippinarum]